MKIDLAKKADPALREALASASEEQILCVILSLDTGKESLKPDLQPSDFPTWREYKQALCRDVTARIYMAVAGTLEELRGFGIDPVGWELGQLVLHANRATILNALSCAGVKFGVLDWDLGIVDWLRNEEECARLALAARTTVGQVGESG